MKYLLNFILLISALFIFKVSNAQWVECSLGILEPSINSIKKSNQLLFIGTSNRGIYRSSNNGVDWEYKSSGMGPKYVQCLYADGSDIYAGTLSHGIYYSSNYGETWVERGFNTSSIYSIGKVGQNIVYQGYYSTNKGISWIKGYLATSVTINSYANLGDTIYAVAGNIYSSTNFGVTWSLCDSVPNRYYKTILASNNILYVGANNAGIYLSTNHGSNWLLFNQGFSGNSSINALENHNGVLYAAYNPTIYYYSNAYNLWMPTNYVYYTNYAVFYDLISFENKLFTILNYPITGLFYTTNNGSNWNKTKVVNNRITSLYNFNNKLFACSDSSGLYHSTNSGDLWINDNLPNLCFTSMTELNSSIFLASADSGIYKSTNNGLNWIYSNNDLPNQNILSLNNKDSNVYAGSTNGLYYSSNSGLNWLSLGFNSKRITAIGVSDLQLLIGTNTGLYISTNNGSNWSTEYLSGKTVNVIKKYNNYVYAGTNENLYCLSESWTNIGINGITVFDIIKYADSALFMATSNGIYRTYNNGLTWKNLNWGSFSLLDYNNYIYRGANSGIAKAPKSSLLTNIIKVNDELPKSFNLCQNYPNPFNPVTKIKIDIPHSSSIRIVIYDINGREVESIINQKYNPGIYEFDWDASNYPSGIYFCKLISAKFSKTIKMLLIK